MIIFYKVIIVDIEERHQIFVVPGIIKTKCFIYKLNNNISLDNYYIWISLKITYYAHIWIMQKLPYQIYYMALNKPVCN